MMTALSIRKIPEAAKQRLRMRAAAKGRSMEAEARDILLTALAADTRTDLNWIEQLITAGEEVGGVDLEVPADEAATAADFATS